jgi:hypothetical protein
MRSLLHFGSEPFRALSSPFEPSPADPAAIAFGSVLSNQIDEQTLVIVIHLGQIIRKITEIIADTHLDMIAQVAV